LKQASNSKKQKRQLQVQNVIELLS